LIAEFVLADKLYYLAALNQYNVPILFAYF